MMRILRISDSNSVQFGVLKQPYPSSTVSVQFVGLTVSVLSHLFNVSSFVRKVKVSQNFSLQKAKGFLFIFDYNFFFKTIFQKQIISWKIFFKFFGSVFWKKSVLWKKVISWKVCECNENFIKVVNLPGKKCESFHKLLKVILFSWI